MQQHVIVITAEPCRVRVHFNGRVVANTTAALALHETGLAPVHYIPATDADMACFERTDHATHCPFKGDASYFSLRVSDRVATNAVWTYESPYPAVAAIAGHLAFYRDRVDAIETIDEV